MGIKKQNSVCLAVGAVVGAAITIFCKIMGWL